MADKSWKSVLLIATLILLVAGLQAGALWSIYLAQHSEPSSRVAEQSLLKSSSSVVQETSSRAATEEAIVATRRFIPLRRDKASAEETPLADSKTPAIFSAPLNATHSKMVLAGVEPLPPLAVTGMVTGADSTSSQKEVKPAAIKPSEAEQQQNQPQTLKASNQTPAATPAAEPAQPATPAVSQAAPAAELQEPVWLTTRDSKRYTLQLHRSKDLEGLKALIKSSALPQPYAYYRTSVKSGAWYVLVAGDYPDAKSATAALAELTKKLPDLKPWMRDFGAIQAQIR